MPDVDINRRRWAICPLPPEAAATLFQVVTRGCLEGWIALTTNLGITSRQGLQRRPRWSPAPCRSPAAPNIMLSINSDSYRMRSHRARTEGLRKGVVQGQGVTSDQTTHRVSQLGNFVDRPWGVSEIGGTWRIQPVSATISVNFSDGVIQPSVLRGRSLRLRAMRSRSSGRVTERSVSLGMYWRNSPLVFSFEPRCQGLCGSQK